MQIVETAGSQHLQLPVRSLSLGISALVIMIGGFLIYRRISAPEILGILLKLDWKWLVLALTAYWIQYPINSFRLERIVSWLWQPDSPRPTFKLILKATLSSGFIASAAPIGLIADAAKAGALRFFWGLSTMDAIRCILFDRVIAAQWMALFGLAVLPQEWTLDVSNTAIGIQLVVSVGIIIAIAILLLLPKALSIFNNNSMAMLALLFTGYRSMLFPRRSFVQMLIMLLNMIMVWLTLYALLRAAGLTINLWLVACFPPFLQLINSVPFLYMGWGGREVAMAVVLGPACGLSLNEALAVSAAWGGVMIVAGAVNGLFMLGGWQLRPIMPT